MNAQPPLRTRRGCRSGSQQGVVLLFALIALAVMLIASVALVRSYNASLYNAGNLAFKRDMRNQAERAIAQVMSTMGSTLSTAASRATSVASANYSALILTTDKKGIPTALMNKTTFDTTYTAGTITVQDNGVSVAQVRYIVDRLCNQAGLETVLGTTNCQIVDGGKQGGSGSHLVRPEDASSSGSTAQLMIVYRITVRVDSPPGSPRDTQAFYQATFTL